MIVVSGRTVPHVEFRLDVELVLLEGLAVPLHLGDDLGVFRPELRRETTPLSGLSLTSSQPTEPLAVLRALRPDRVGELRLFVKRLSH